MTDALTYNSTVLVQGNGSQALEMATVALASAGFRLENKTASSVQFLAPQIIILPPRNPFPGASKVLIEVAAGRISMVAELGVIARMRRFLRFLPVCSALFVGLVVGVALVVRFGAAEIGDWGPTILPVVGPSLILGALLLAFLGAFLVRHVESHTRTALDTLMQNVTVIIADA